MRSLMIAALAAASAVAVTASSPAQALEYQYCLQGENMGYPGDCQYYSFAQCKAAASGTNADCGINPMVAFGAERGYGAYAYAPLEDSRGAYGYAPVERRLRW
ncbi:hypothetical protein HNR60_002579 [Rhodopseudomonas rhenobacensis]|uniref:DUF3551 domain-containing protein n=1 Tax=Rhodopseudomonas rhenobacensis TaxID=87461 RepID=A0A7W8DZF8_9BRAD|nr:DUF3551 domain-containing protein [Rhodopseudomonas rhenobacensis]MBB5047822.1 hypothetical protein [Rhodopseudomonas rhenobacensis]